MIYLLKRITILLLIPAVLFLGSCGKSDDEGADQSLYEHGLDVISLMVEMASNNQYTELFIGNSDVLELVSAAGTGDFTKPSSVYRITAKDSLGTMSEFIPIEGLSDTLMEQVESRLFSALVTQINSMGGSVTLSAASICTASKLFVSRELEENQIYLYIYQDAVPVAVTFTKGENGAVSASGMFILYQDFTVETIQESSGLMQEFGITIEEITKETIGK